MRPASKTELRIGVCVGVVLCVPELPSELSRDILFLLFEAAAPGRAKSPSWVGFARGVFDRCDKVDLRNDTARRTGVDEPLTGGKYWVLPSWYILMSSGVRCFGVWSKMLAKSWPSPDAPCTLRRFAVGLLPVPPVRFMRASLRLSGLDFAGGAGDKSGRDCAKANLIGLSLTGRWSVSMQSGESALDRRGVFSCPCIGRLMKGVALPTSVESPSGRRGGVFDLVRVRGDDRNG